MNGGGDRGLEFRKELWKPGCQCVRLLDYTRAERNSHDNQKPDQREVDEGERQHLDRPGSRRSRSFTSGQSR